MRGNELGTRALLFWGLALAFAVRAFGIDFGLPHLYYWDEPTVINRAVRFGSGDFDPHFYYYPALLMYVLFGVFGGYYLFGRVIGHFERVEDFAVEYFLDPTRAYLVARLTVALCGTLVVAVTYVVGKRYLGRRAGIMAALFTAVSLLHASHSHVAVTDVPQSLFIIAAYLPLHGVLCRGRSRDYALSGLMIGLGVATKYLAILLLPSLLLAHHLRLRARRETEPVEPREPWLSRKLTLAGFACAAAFFAGSPFNVIKFSDFLADYHSQAALSSMGGGYTSLRFFLGEVLPADLGWPLLLVAGAGLALWLFSGSHDRWLLASFPLVYFAFVARFPSVFARYMIPEDPFLALMAASALDAAFLRARALFPERARLRQGALALCAAGLASVPFHRLLRWDWLMATSVDTRTAALIWAERNIPPGSRIAVQPLYDRTFFNVPLLTDLRLRAAQLNIPVGGRFESVRERVLRGLEQRPVYREVQFVEDANRLLRRGAEYVFLSDSNVPGDPTSQLDYQRLRAELERVATEARIFLPESLPAAVREGGDIGVVPVTPPIIRVYRLQ